MKPILTFLIALLLAPLAALQANPETVRSFDVRQFGAIPDGKTLNTAAIQKAIDACNAAGGGTVRFAGGEFVTGTIYFKDNVTLRIEAGAALLGSTNIADYAIDTHKNMYKNEPHMDRCLIFGRGVSGIGLEGNGIIDGRGGVGRTGEPGHRAFFPNKDDPQRNRPMLLRLVDCARIRVRDVTLRNPAAWTSAWLYCRDIVVDGVSISSRACGNGDGLDFDGCENVRVANSAFDTSDDSICLQTSRKNRPCRNVTIHNCIFISKWAGIRIGLLSQGDFEAVTVSNCIFRDIADSGLKIQLCEGGEMKNMVFANLVMINVPRPVFMTFGQQRAGADTPEGVLAPMKALRNMMFSNLLVDDSACGKDSAFILAGLPGHPIENITLENIRFSSGGGGAMTNASPKFLPDLTPERLNGWWPEYSLFKRPVPCFGIYAGHVKGLTIRDVNLTTQEADARPAIICDDVIGLELDRVRVGATASTEPLVFLNNVTNELVNEVRSTGAPRQILQREIGKP